MEGFKLIGKEQTRKKKGSFFVCVYFETVKNDFFVFEHSFNSKEDLSDFFRELMKLKEFFNYNDLIEMKISDFIRKELSEISNDFLNYKKIRWTGENKIEYYKTENEIEIYEK